MTTGDTKPGTSQRGTAMTTALAQREQPNGDARLLLHSKGKRRSVALPPAKGKRWQPPEGLTPTEVQAVIDAAAEGRDRLLLRRLWATADRVSEARLPAHRQSGLAGAVAALVEAAGLARQRSPLLLAKTRRRWQPPVHLPRPGLEDRQKGVSPRWHTRAGDAAVAAWRLRRTGPGASPPAASCPCAPARAINQELAAGPEAGGMVAVAHGVPHHRRRRGAGAHARRHGVMYSDHTTGLVGRGRPREWRVRRLSSWRTG